MSVSGAASFMRAWLWKPLAAATIVRRVRRLVNQRAVTHKIPAPRLRQFRGLLFRSGSPSSAWLVCPSCCQLESDLSRHLYFKVVLPEPPHWLSSVPDRSDFRSSFIVARNHRCSVNQGDRSVHVRHRSICARASGGSNENQTSRCPFSCLRRSVLHTCVGRPSRYGEKCIAR